MTIKTRLVEAIRRWLRATIEFAYPHLISEIAEAAVDETDLVEEVADRLEAEDIAEHVSVEPSAVAEHLDEQEIAELIYERTDMPNLVARELDYDELAEAVIRYQARRAAAANRS